MIEEHVPLDLIADHPFFSSLKPNHQEMLAACARRRKFKTGDQILAEGDPANRFYVIGYGGVELSTVDSHRKKRVIQTLHDGDVLGWSWLFSPFRWHFDAHAKSQVRALEFDAAMVLNLCETDTELGFQLMRRFANVMLARLQMTRRQMLGEPSSSS